MLSIHESDSVCSPWQQRADLSYLQAGEQLGELGEERQEDKTDEVCL